jgi:hypothetical protein
MICTIWHTCHSLRTCAIQLLHVPEKTTVVRKFCSIGPGQIAITGLLACVSMCHATCRRPRWASNGQDDVPADGGAKVGSSERLNWQIRRSTGPTTGACIHSHSLVADPVQQPTVRRPGFLHRADAGPVRRWHTNLSAGNCIGRRHRHGGLHTDTAARWSATFSGTDNNTWE